MAQQQHLHPTTHAARHPKAVFAHGLHRCRHRSPIVSCQRRGDAVRPHAVAASRGAAAASSGLAPVATPVQAPQGAVSRAPQLVRSRVIKNRRGLFRLRHLQEADLHAVAQLQAASFHESPPLKALDGLAFTLFRAEVLSAVQKKAAVLADDGFAVMVVESCSPHGGGDGPQDLDGGVAQGRGELLAEHDAAVWYGDQQATAGQHGARGEAAAPGRILGVIEVGVQDEPDVLQHLPQGIDTYAYISSMAVAPHLRGCGIGAALLQAAEQQAALWGQPLVALHVYATNARAIRLYERHGLQREARDPSWRQLVGGKVRQLHVKYL